MSKLNEDEIWKLIEVLMNTLVSHQVDSYEHFINHSINDIIINNTIDVYTDVDKSVSNKDVVRFYHSKSCKSIYKPYHQENNGTIIPMFPSDARLRI